MLEVEETWHTDVCGQCGKKLKVALVKIDYRHCPLAALPAAVLAGWGRQTVDPKTGSICDGYRVKDAPGEWHYDCRRCVKDNVETKRHCQECLRIRRVVEAF